MQNNKIFTYLGFAKKAGYLIYGFDNIKIYEKKLYLIIICKTANEKFMQLAKTKQSKTDCKILITKEDLLDDFLMTDNCKIIGIKNKSLSDAIVENKNNILEGKLT